MEVIREELELVRDQFGDERRTEITANSSDINIEDLINREDVVVTLSHRLREVSAVDRLRSSASGR